MQGRNDIKFLDIVPIWLTLLKMTDRAEADYTVT